MTENTTSLGSCPFCGDTIVEGDVQIRYESARGKRIVWAECPGCREIVDPV